MTRRRTGGTRDWRQLLSQTLSRNRLARGVDKARPVLLWPEVVGADLARLTRARSLQRGVLFVDVQDSVLANFLTMQRGVFLTRLQTRLGDDSVTELRFGVGTWAQAAAPPRLEPLPPPDEARARRLVEGVPENVRDSALPVAEAITRARRWREREGWPECPICGVPSRVVPCLPCARLLDSPEVARAARDLARRPEHLAEIAASLGETSADAARNIALASVAGQLDVLALECVRAGGEGEYREFLKSQAQVWLALFHRKARAELSRADWAALPERPRQVLSAGR